MNAPTGNASEFVDFLDRLRMNAGGKKVLVILDNASFHKSKRVREHLEATPGLKLFFLPTYSPEYNPVEGIWKWTKKHVHAAKTIEDGIKEMTDRFGRVIDNWMSGAFVKKPEIGMGIWRDLLVGYL